MIIAQLDCKWLALLSLFVLWFFLKLSPADEDSRCTCSEGERKVMGKAEICSARKGSKIVESEPEQRSHQGVRMLGIQCSHFHFCLLGFVIVANNKDLVTRR